MSYLYTLQKNIPEHIVHSIGDFVWDIQARSIGLSEITDQNFLQGTRIKPGKSSISKFHSIGKDIVVFIHKEKTLYYIENDNNNPVVKWNCKVNNHVGSFVEISGSLFYAELVHNYIMLYKLTSSNCSREFGLDLGVNHFYPIFEFNNYLYFSEGKHRNSSLLHKLEIDFPTWKRGHIMGSTEVLPNHGHQTIVQEVINNNFLISGSSGVALYDLDWNKLDEVTTYSPKPFLSYLGQGFLEGYDNISRSLWEIQGNQFVSIPFLDKEFLGVKTANYSICTPKGSYLFDKTTEIFKK